MHTVRKPGILLGFSILWVANAFVISAKPRPPSEGLLHRLFSSNEPNPTPELTSALARLDRQWQIQQSNKQGRSRWTTLNIDDDNTVESASPPVPGQIANKNTVYLLEPPSQSVPSCLIVFVGGAGLGTYPQIAYNELLLRISNRLNAAILSAPYNVGLDHFALAKETGERARRAIEFLQDDPSHLYPPSLPVYCITHSLGGKLATIHMVATNQDYSGIGLISFNNFGFGKTIGMARGFADQIRANMGVNKPQDRSRMGGLNQEILDQVFSFAEMAVSTIGIDFTPTAEQMERLIALKYDQDLQAKTRLFTFDDDTLQNTKDFVDACSGAGPEVSELTGTHLTPVFFEFGLDQIPDDGVKDIAREAMGGFEKVSFGDAVQLNGLVDEICSWILGKGPSRKPSWERETPLIAASPEANTT